MKKNNFSLSGMSTPNTIYFIGDKYSVEVNTKTGFMAINKNTMPKSGFVEFIMKIPIIRGMFMFFYVFFFILSDFFRSLVKQKPVFIAIQIIIFGTVFYFLRNVSPSAHPVVAKGVSAVAWVVLAFFYMIMFLFLYTARTNHSIEHKVIGAYDKEKNLNLRVIKKQPKENPRCGGVIVAWLLVLYAGYWLITGKGPLFITTTILFSLAYELARLARTHKFFYMPGFYLQKLTTSKKMPLVAVKRAQKAVLMLVRKERQPVRTR